MTIEQGDSVEFINDNGFHDVVITSGPEMLTLPACSGPCDIGVLVFNTPGEYEYICSIGSHSSLGMVGVITVNETSQILGCTDQYAENYNSNANVDDGSCAGYPDNGHFSLNFDGSGHISISEKNINEIDTSKLPTQKIKEVWSGSLIKSLRDMHKKGEWFKNDVCKECVMSTANIDDAV